MGSQNSVEEQALVFIQTWLQMRAKGTSGAAFTFSPEYADGIPQGYYASIRLELHKLGGEPKEYEKCKCGEMHEKGTECPYATTG